MSPSPQDAPLKARADRPGETPRPESAPQDHSSVLLTALRRSLGHALTALNQKWDEPSFRAERTEPPSDEAPDPDASRKAACGARGEARSTVRTRTYQVEDDGAFSLLVHFSVSPLPRPRSMTSPRQSDVLPLPEEGPYRVCVGIKDGPTVHYTARRGAQDAPPAGGDGTTGEGTGRAPVAALSRKVTAFLLREIEHRLGSTSSHLPSQSPPSSTVARLSLSREGEIRYLTPRARDLLGYEKQETLDPNFFSHVDGHNLRRVMCDLAEMVESQKQGARWLLRMQTAEGRWRWFRAAVQNKLRSSGAIEVILRPLSSAPDREHA